MRGSKAKKCRLIAGIIMGDDRTVKMTGAPVKYRFKKDKEGNNKIPLEFERAERGIPYKHAEGTYRHLYKGIKRNARKVRATS